MTPAPKRVEICKFPGNKRIAFTTSWDDGVVEDRRLVKLFNELGIKGTFNLNSGAFGRETHLPADEIASLFEGHEVAIHTVTHPWLDRIDVSQAAYEILDDKRALEDLVGYPVRGMALPFGVTSPKVSEVIRSLGIVYCRTTGNAERCFPPVDPINWQTTMHMFHTNPPLVERFEAWKAMPKRSEVFFVWGHSFEFARPRDRWDEMEKLFRPVAGHAEVWYCTNIELFDYEAARQRIAIAANRRSAYNPSAVTVALLVDGALVDVPGGKTVALV